MLFMPSYKIERVESIDGSNNTYVTKITLKEKFTQENDSIVWVAYENTNNYQSGKVTGIVNNEDGTSIITISSTSEIVEKDEDNNYAKALFFVGYEKSAADNPAIIGINSGLAEVGNKYILG
jgi:hypothetical protein